MVEVGVRRVGCGLSGITSASLTYPLDLVRTCLAAHVALVPRDAFGDYKVFVFPIYAAVLWTLQIAMENIKEAMALLSPPVVGSMKPKCALKTFSPEMTYFMKLNIDVHQKVVKHVIGAKESSPPLFFFWQTCRGSVLLQKNYLVSSSNKTQNVFTEMKMIFCFWLL